MSDDHDNQIETARMFGTILAKLDNIEKYDMLQEKRIASVEIKQIETDKNNLMLKTVLDSLQVTVNKLSETVENMRKKTPWWQVVGGISAGMAIIAALFIIVPQVVN